MNDFVFANRDGLATYIIYERGSTKGGKPIVVSGEAINIAVSYISFCLHRIYRIIGERS